LLKGTENVFKTNGITETVLKKLRRNGMIVMQHKSTVTNPKTIRRWLRKAIELQVIWNARSTRLRVLPGIFKNTSHKNPGKNTTEGLELRNFNPS